jgi:hypothetical protein
MLHLVWHALQVLQEGVANDAAAGAYMRVLACVRVPARVRARARVECEALIRSMQLEDFPDQLTIIIRPYVLFMQLNSLAAAKVHLSLSLSLSLSLWCRGA